jgi:hypothetical protein
MGILDLGGARTSNKPEYRAVSGAESADLMARHETPWESSSWQCFLRDQLGVHAQSGKDGWGRIRWMIHVASFFHRDLTLHRKYRVFDQGCRVIGLSKSGTGCSCRRKVWRCRQGFGVMYSIIHAPWAVVLSQTRSHSSLSAFGAATKRMLAGLELRRL